MHCFVFQFNTNMYPQSLIALLLLSSPTLFAQDRPAPTTAQNNAVLNIGERTFDFTDATRNRPVVTEVWYPTTDTLQKDDKAFSPFVRRYTVRNGKLPPGPLPLIMLSHGTGGGRLTLQWLAQSLVQSGFIVAAVDHWGNTYDHKIAIEFLKPWERPLDISFALTELLKDNELRTVIDPQRIGAIGFSYGGYTVLALAGAIADYPVMIHYYKTIGHKELELPEFPGLAKYLDDSALLAAMQQVPLLKDSRIKAFFAISPGTGPGFVKKQQFVAISGPVFITGSQSDSIAPVKTNAGNYHRLITGSGYYEFPGRVGHYVMLDEAVDDLKKSLPTYFSDDPSVSRHQVHLQVDSLAGSFFKRNLK
jgi:predicted dienelactone hydrolase